MICDFIQSLRGRLFPGLPGLCHLQLAKTCFGFAAQLFDKA
jgi:hypothetical protein